MMLHADKNIFSFFENTDGKIVELTLGVNLIMQVQELLKLYRSEMNIH